jgi:peptide/nickel transport system permease protein
VLLFVIGGSIIISEADSNFIDLEARLSPPSLKHPFGTDNVGRDILARTIYGGQISIIIGLLAVFVSIVLGVLIGGRSFSGSVIVIICVIGLTSWMYLARIVRANVLSLKEQEFVTAAKCIGASNLSIIFAHILPNTLAPVIVSATLQVAGSIISEAYVSFLGVGVQPPTATWGNMLDQAYHHLESEPWMWFFPGMFILLTVLAINFVGDGLRDAMDPRALVETD